MFSFEPDADFEESEIQKVGEVSTTSGTGAAADAAADAGSIEEAAADADSAASTDVTDGAAADNGATAKADAAAFTDVAAAAAVVDEGVLPEDVFVENEGAGDPGGAEESGVGDGAEFESTSGSAVYKNHVYKNIEAQISQNLRTC